jgi:threonine/homoserine/homoserine lactone efflux protein
MDTLWLNICSVLLVFTVAIVSPGPNFILVLNRSLADSRRTGIYSAFGVATGSAMFALAGLLGLLVLISSLPYFSVIIRYLGSCYLVYLGVSILLSCRQPTAAPAATEPLAPISAYRSGLLTNLTNPKAWALYLSLSTLFIETAFPSWATAFMVISIFLISFSWYALVVVLSSGQRLKRSVRLQALINIGLGVLLVFLGGKLLLKH